MKEAVRKTLELLESRDIDLNSSDIDTSTAKYEDFYKEWRKRTSRPKYSNEYLEEEKKQIAIEREFLDKFEACEGKSYFSTEELQSRLGSIDMAKFGSMLTGDFFNDNVMNAMVCLSSSTHLASSSSLSPNERVRAWIRNLRRVGSESVSGIALMADVGYGEEIKSPFIVKSLRNLDNATELIHEAFIGLAALNHMRKLVPNFAYIYGFTECSPPFPGPATKDDPKAKKIATFCNSKNPEDLSIQVIYENVIPAVSMDEAVKTMSGRNFIQYYLAILMALYKANEMYNFCHYDLHDQNALLRSCTDARLLEARKSNPKAEFYVPYELKFQAGYKKFYVSSPDGIPTIIDYGRSYVKVDGKDYGMPNSLPFNKRGIFRNRSNPIYDAFKFLGFCLIDAYEAGNVDLFGSIAPLFRYFSVGESVIESVADIYKGTNFDLPLFGDLDNLEDFINFTIQYADALGYENVVTDRPPEGAFILTPVSDKLQLNVLEKVGLDKRLLSIPQPKTILEVYDVLTKQSKAYNYYSKKKSIKLANQAVMVYRTVRDKFNLASALSLEMDRLGNVVKDCTKSAKVGTNFTSQKKVNLNVRASKISFPKSIDLYFNKNLLTKIKNYVGDFALLTELVQTLGISVKAMYYLYRTYEAVKDQNALSKLKPVLIYVNEAYNSLLPEYRQYVTDLTGFANMFAYDKNVPKDVAWFKSVLDWTDNNNTIYEWYFNVSSTISSLSYIPEQIDIR
jgi:hypothetical protein